MKLRYLFSALLILTIAFVINSCKKEGQNSIPKLFTGGTWELASITVFKFTGTSTDTTFTLQDSCQTSQYFTFNADNTCTYLNYGCTLQKSSGTWSLTNNNLILVADMTAPGDTVTNSAKPFYNAAIINLGQYSLVLNTGDIQPNYSLTAKRTIVQYGFIRAKTTNGN